MPKEPIIREGIITDLTFPNRGKMHPAVESSAADTFVVAEKTAEKTITVKNALPGQKVRVSVGRSGKRRREGRLLEVVEKAPYEISPLCPHAAFCGGCSWQTVPYEQQLAWKEKMVKDLLKDPLMGADPAWEPIVASPLQYGYRNKMEFSFGDEIKNGPLTLGLHKRGAAHDIINTPDCAISPKDFCSIVQETKAFFSAAGIPQYNSYTHEGVLRHLVLRRSFADGGILINLVTTSKLDADLQAWVQTLTRLPLEGYIRGILHTINDRDADVVQSDATQLLYGEAYLDEALLGLSFRIFPFSFFQTNSKGAEKLYEVVRDFAGDVSGAEVFDLYCGTGTIAQILAGGGAKSVTGIEIVEEAVEAARVNAERNGLANCHFIAGDVLKQVDQLTTRPDVVILDPPRDGIHPKALPKILEFKPERFVYVSCKPTSLARDLPYFREAGYEPTRIRMVDMFPNTPNIETICAMTKCKGENA